MFRGWAAGGGKIEQPGRGPIEYWDAAKDLNPAKCERFASRQSDSNLRIRRTLGNAGQQTDRGEGPARRLNRRLTMLKRTDSETYRLAAAFM